MTPSLARVHRAQAATALILLCLATAGIARGHPAPPSEPRVLTNLTLVRSLDRLTAPEPTPMSLATPTPAPAPAKPAPAPKVAPRPVEAAVAAPASSVKARIAAAWPGDDQWALRVSWCESRHNPTATNGQYQGLFQMGNWARSYTGWTLPLAQASVEYQTAKAWKLYSEVGPSQWACK